jgi:hypothetical protein
LQEASVVTEQTLDMEFCLFTCYSPNCDGAVQNVLGAAIFGTYWMIAVVFHHRSRCLLQEQFVSKTTIEWNEMPSRLHFGVICSVLFHGTRASFVKHWFVSAELWNVLTDVMWNTVQCTFNIHAWNRYCFIGFSEKTRINKYTIK